MNLEGGHNIETEVIIRRYKHGIKNLFEIYLPIVDGILIFDNSDKKNELMAEQNSGTDLKIIDVEKFNKLKKLYEEQK